MSLLIINSTFHHLLRVSWGNPLVVRTPAFTAKGPGSIPGQGTKIPQAVVVSSLHCDQFLQPHGCSLPGSSVHGILQARILEWVAKPCGAAKNKKVRHL